jgi:hypothetical protein
MQLIELGTHRLRGLQRPEHVYELASAGMPSKFPPLNSLDAFPGTISLPVPPFARADEELAGRDVELHRLASVWKEASAGDRQVGLISGEQGIGKSRLAAEFSRRVHARGGAVLYGRCDEDAIVPYQPFVEALRPYVCAASASVLRERLHGLEYDLGRVFPELLGRLPEAPSSIQSDPETERYRLFEAVASVLTGITVARPIVLVLDDLHWADKPTLQLLRHLVRGTPHAALLILACYLDVELEQDRGLADLFADLRRETSVTSVSLSGLSEADSGELLKSLAGRGLPRSLVRALHGETDGNPFFLEELARHLIETDAALLEPGNAQHVTVDGLNLPERVREVVARRLRRMPSAVNDVLSIGAVVGTEFDAVLVGRAAEQPASAVLEVLDQATRAGLVHEHASQVGRYTFAHALIRQTLYAGLGTAQRAKLHARVGTAMEAVEGNIAAAALAQHFTKALPFTEAKQAIEYTSQAGHEALADLAFEDAATHFERALQLLDEYAPADKIRRVELLTDLASASVYVDERAGVETARLAVESARADGSPAQFGHAVAAFVEPTYGAAAFPAEVTSLFDEARAVLGDSEPALQARLLAYVAFKYASYQVQGRDGRALAEQAVALARPVGDPSTLADGLFALAFNLEGSPDVAARLALGEELVGLSGAGARARAFGLHVLARAHLELGQAEALRTTTAELARIGDELRWFPARVQAARWRATQGLLEGRFGDVRTSGDEMRKHARAYHGAGGMQTHQAFYLAREEGTLARASAVGHITLEHLGTLYIPACLALAHLESGDEQAALGILDRLSVDDFLGGEWESARGGALGMLAEVAATGGTAAQASALYDLLTPFAGRLLAAVYATACLGAADRYLGMLSTRLERWRDAEVHFEQAWALEDQIGGSALVPRTRYWQARFLLARGHRGDRRTARALLTSVIKETTRLGMRHLHAQADSRRKDLTATRARTRVSDITTER